ncbi:MAG TPA: AIM24 family protein [Magnetospirillaceae bacterium]|jgi:uncharacterized protein (TIGR00266 family)
MKHTLIGTTMPVLQMELAAGEKIIAEPGEFSWMSPNIALHTTTQTAGARGLFSVLGRALSGGGLFMTEYTAQGGPGYVAFAARVPGMIHEVQVERGAYLIHKHGFLCATEGVQLSIAFQQRLGSGLFGGNGFILQRLAGPCTAFVELGGESVIYDLPPGQSMLVHPGHVGMFEESVNFEITMMRGIRNALFGADGLFMAALTGPGRIWLQSMTVPNLAHAIAPYIVENGGGGSLPGGVAGGIIGNLMRGQ